MKNIDDLKTLLIHAFPNDKIYLFGTIQRFEFTLEIAWKSIKSFLVEEEEVECRSPKSSMKELFATAHLNEPQISTMLQMVDDGNLSTHAN
ncbi:nucleotidyltransferase substrate binding protein [Sulfurovum sp.]|uniref:nucleotidyltransferase substrate binding protein n=1 Tax=Sulfurovum sp. TaxID=1969726 RepID=UPI0025D2F3E9|nr:nucleotidyltransferase substrate binding protein [Sulfurovum sp.]